MAAFSQCWTVCQILAKAYPNPLTKEEIRKEAHRLCPHFFTSVSTVDFVLGIINGVRDGDWRQVVCWKEEDGKIVYDISRKRYAPTLGLVFTLIFNRWLKEQGLEKLILVNPITPENSSRCPLGASWEKILSASHCDWDYEDQNCHCSKFGCGIDRQKVDRWLKGEIEEPF